MVAQENIHQKELKQGVGQIEQLDSDIGDDESGVGDLFNDHMNTRKLHVVLVRVLLAVGSRVCSRAADEFANIIRHFVFLSGQPAVLVRDVRAEVAYDLKVLSCVDVMLHGRVDHVEEVVVEDL